MKIGWILGWAVPEAWFEELARTYLPERTHVFVSASPDAINRLERFAPFDWVVGYSLGTLLLLAEADRAERLGRVALLAPIFSFLSEANLGGRISKAQLRVLSRWVERDPAAAVADFYERAGLDAAKADSLDGLSWGLERLETMSAPPRLPPGWHAWCGEEDSILDAKRLHELVPGVAVVPGATHHPAGLLRAFAVQMASNE